MNKTRRAFLTSANRYIRQFWVKHKNPLFPKDPPNYPVTVGEYVYVTIDGKRKYFYVSVREAADFSKKGKL